MSRFWDAAVALEPAAADLDEGRRMAGCNPPALEALFSGAGLVGVETLGIDAPTVFAGFDDYCVSLPEDRSAALRERLRETLHVEADGSIRLIARAWAVRGTRPL